jgi:mannitol/fructose-specific phosphotransferase system IIA component (Ntr-type)
MDITSPTDDCFPLQCDHCKAVSIVNVTHAPGDLVCPGCEAFLWVQAVTEVTRRFEFVPDVRIPMIESTDRDEVLTTIVGRMAQEAAWSPRRVDEFRTAILRREEFGSTGIGHGFALPHAKASWVQACTTAMAFVPHGVDFDALDGKPVHTVILLASPQTAPADHLRTLDRVARSIRSLEQLRG